MTAHLLIDAGNTRIKWMLVADVNGLEKIEHGDALSHDDAPLTSLMQLAQQYSALSITASNVAGAAIKQKLADALRPHRIHFINSVKNCCDVENSYTNPEQLGTDRFAALIAARQIVTTPALIVMAGTALTIDAMSADGVFLGGAILPGLTLMRTSLKHQTAQLPLVALVDEVVAPSHVFACDTEAAIASGTLDASIGAIVLNARRLEALNNSTITIIASGGAIHMLAPILANQYQFTIKIVDDLVLRGLQRIARSHKGASINSVIPV
jgi:type III pantothenate kinase